MEADAANSWRQRPTCSRPVSGLMGDAIFLRRDPLLAPLRDETRFGAIVEQVEREVAEMRARADFSSLNE